MPFPRLKRAQKADPYWPVPTPLPIRPLGAGLFRVCRSFTAGGYTFQEGALVSPDNALVQEVHRQHPGYLQFVPNPNPS